MRKWTKNDFAYAIDSDVISHGYKKDFHSEEDEKYDLGEVSLLEIIGLSIYNIILVEKNSWEGYKIRCPMSCLCISRKQITF